MSTPSQLQARPECACDEDEENVTIANLRHHFIRLQPKDELAVLLEILRVFQYTQVVVFVKNPQRCAALSDFLNESGFTSTCIHGELSPNVQSKRYLQFQRMEEGTPPISILVTCHLGHAMEFHNVNIAILFDEADSVQAYLHQVSSRLARKGLVINFVKGEAHFRVLKAVETSYNVMVEELPEELCISTYMVA